jgi:hypothetical protein
VRKVAPRARGTRKGEKRKPGAGEGKGRARDTILDRPVCIDREKVIGVGCDARSTFWSSPGLKDMVVGGRETSRERPPYRDVEKCRGGV